MGFTDNNRNAFDTLYTERKIADGGTGFGRFTCLKYCDRVSVASTFADGDAFRDRTFSTGLDKDIIVDEQLMDSQSLETVFKFKIAGIKSVRFPEQGMETISSVVVERSQAYFVDT